MAKRKRNRSRRYKPDPLKTRLAKAAAVIFPGVAKRLAKEPDASPKVSYRITELKDEISKAQNTFSTMFGGDTYRASDKIIRTKGKSRFAFYDDMADSDAVLAGIIETRIDSVARLPWDIIPATDEESDIEIAKYVKQALMGLRNFDEDLSELLAACRNGYAVSEIIWKDDEIDGKQMLVPDRILSKPPDWFRFDADRNLLFIGDSSMTKGTVMPDYKFIHYAFRSRYQNPYGMSLLRSVYWVWWFKHYGLEQWMRALERGAVGTVIMKYERDTPPDEQDGLEETAKIILKSKYGVICKDHEIEFPEIKIDANFGDVLIQRCNAEMIYRLLGATLSSGTSESGTRALGEVHERRLQERNESDSKALAACLNKSLIRFIVELNFPDVKEFPKFKQHYEAAKDDTVTINKLRAAAELGIPVAVVDAASMLDLPLAEEGVETIQPINFRGGAPAIIPDTESEEDEELEPEEGGDTGDEMIKRKQSPVLKDISPEALAILKTRQDNFRYTKDKIAVASYKAGLPVYDEFADQIDIWLLKNGTIEKAIENFDDFSLDIRKFKSTLHDTLLWGLLNGMFIVFDLPKYKRKNSTEAEPNPRVDYVFLAVEKLARWKPMKAADAIKHFKEKGILTDKEFKQLDAWSRRNSLTAARMSEDAITNTLKPALEKALDEGMTVKQFQKVVRETVISDAHAENIFRTNVSTSFVSGNMESSRTEHGKSAIPAMEFMAVLDDRTTDMCAERDGQIYHSDGVEEMEIVPPLHFMCRSDLIPVFEDEWDGKVSAAPKVRSLEGFGRWKPILEKAA